MLKENLVFLPDSPYSDWIITRSEKVVGGVSDYVTFGNTIKKFHSKECRQIGIQLAELKEFAKIIPSYQRIIIHYHHELIAYLLGKADFPSEKIIWVLWSGDLYNTPFYDEPIYLPLTSPFGVQTLPTAPKGMQLLKEKIKYLLGRPGLLTFKNSFKRIHYIATFFEGDLRNAERVFKKKYSLIPFALLSAEELLDPALFKVSLKSGSSSKILLGHAGVPENNHLDLFARLKEMDLPHTLLCPLSYGNPIYCAEIINEGNLQFGDRFEPITRFLPRDEYYKMISAAGFAVFNTLIQQAFGNILGLLFIGVKVFLHEQNSIFEKMKRIGVNIFSIDELNAESLSQPLTPEEIDHNRDILKNVFSEVRINEFYRSLIQFKAS